MNIEERAAQAAANGHETLDTDSSAVAEEKGDLVEQIGESTVRQLARWPIQ